MQERFAGPRMFWIRRYSMESGQRYLGRTRYNHYGDVSTMLPSLSFRRAYEGQHTGSMSIKSSGQMLRGARFNRDTTFVAAVWVTFAGRAKEGQQSGRSLEQPTKGTSRIDPSGKGRAVYCGISQVPT